MLFSNEKMVIDHIAYLVDDMEAAIQFYRKTFGLALLHSETLEQGKLSAALLGSERSGSVPDSESTSQKASNKIELISPNDSESSLARRLAKHGAGFHHVCYQVSDIETALRELSVSGLRLVDSIPRRGMADSRIAFLHPQSTMGVLTELCQPHDGSV